MATREAAGGEWPSPWGRGQAFRRIAATDQATRQEIKHFSLSRPVARLPEMNKSNSRQSSSFFFISSASTYWRPVAEVRPGVSDDGARANSAAASFAYCHGRLT